MKKEEFLKVEMKYHFKSAQVIALMGIIAVLMLLAHFQIFGLSDPLIPTVMIITIFLLLVLVGAESFLANRSLRMLREMVKK